MISIKSHINTNSAQFKENKAAMEKLLEKLEGHLEESRFEGKESTLIKPEAETKCWHANASKWYWIKTAHF